MKISILCHTARPDYCLTGNPDKHVFEVLLDSVATQDFPYLSEVEVIFIDARYSQRHHLFGADNHSFNGKRYPCVIKHVDQTTENPYFRHGLWVEALALNKGIVAAAGELLMTTADKSGFLSPNILSKAWSYYKNEGKFLLVGWHNLTYGSAVVPEGLAADHRYDVIAKEGLTTKVVSGGWFYGYSFYSLQAALKVNGYDTALDCIKGVVDCDLGLRLESKGYKFVIDTSLYMARYNVTHYDFLNQDIIPGVLTDSPVPRVKNSFKPNVGIMMMNYWDGHPYANSRILTQKDMDRAWECFRLVYVNNTTDYSPVAGTTDYELLQWWFKNQMLMNLKTLR